MSTIIAGRFKTQAQVEEAVSALRDAGFPPERISSFYVNPPGQHDLYPIGGDEDKSPGAEDTDKGAVAGIAVGAAAGLAVSPVIGPIGPMVGAYVGAFVGSLASTKGVEDDRTITAPEHHSGMLVAVAIDTPQQRQRAAQTLAAAGGTELETADGHIEGGDWIDFDPRTPPRFLALPAAQI